MLRHTFNRFKSFFLSLGKMGGRCFLANIIVICDVQKNALISKKVAHSKITRTITHMRNDKRGDDET